MWYTLNTGAAFEVIPRLRSGLLGSQLRVYVWVSWSSPRGQPEVSLDGEASLRSRSPKPQLGRQLEVSRRSAGPLSKQRVGSEKVVKGCFVGVRYTTRFLSGSFFLRPSPSTLPSMRCLPFSSVPL